MNEKLSQTLDIPKTIRIAEEAAQKAGNYLLEKLGQAKVEYQKSSRDELLDVDLGAEKIILTWLQKETPNIGILSEEAGIIGRQDQYWIIDPLDGSSNFQHGNPTFAIAIALMVNEIAKGSIIYIPTRNETFTAIQDQGAYLNNKKIEVSKTQILSEAVIHVGDFTKEDDPETTNEGLHDFSKIAIPARRIRMIGTAATDLAYVACGRAEGLINHTTNPWDIEAGKLLLLEAGGKYSTLQRKYGKPLAIYSNENLHEEIKLLFSDARVIDNS